MHSFPASPNSEVFQSADRFQVLAMHGGSGSRKDELDKDTERFFRAVDRAIVEHHTKPVGVPMVLAELSEVAMAALGGRVRTLLIEDDRIVPGRVDRLTGRLFHGELSDPHAGDMLDDLAEIVLRRGGDAVIVPRDRMPSVTGIAAIYRF